MADKLLRLAVFGSFVSLIFPIGYDFVKEFVTGTNLDAIQIVQLWFLRGDLYLVATSLAITALADALAYGASRPRLQLVIVIGAALWAVFSAVAFYTASEQYTGASYRAYANALADEAEEAQRKTGDQQNGEQDTKRHKFSAKEQLAVIEQFDFIPSPTALADTTYMEDKNVHTAWKTPVIFFAIGLLIALASHLIGL